MSCDTRTTKYFGGDFAIQTNETFKGCVYKCKFLARPMSL